MKTILAAIFVASFAVTAFASETTHDGQLVRDTKVKQVATSAKGFGTTLGQTTGRSTNASTNQLGADRGAFSGK